MPTYYNNGYTSHLCMGKRLLAFLCHFYRYHKIDSIIFCLSMKKGESKIMLNTDILFKRNQLITQNEYIEHKMFKDPLSECPISIKKYSMSERDKS